MTELSTTEQDLFDLFLQDTSDEGKLWDLAGFRQLRQLLQWSLLDVFPM